MALERARIVLAAATERGEDVTLLWDSLAKAGIQAQAQLDKVYGAGGGATEQGGATAPHGGAKLKRAAPRHAWTRQP